MSASTTAASVARADDKPYFISRGERIEVVLHQLDEARSPFASFGMARGARTPAGASPQSAASVRSALGAADYRFRSAVEQPSHLARVELKGARVARFGRVAMTLATDMIILEGVHQGDLEFAKSEGAVVVNEGSDGKVLLRAENGPAHVFSLVSKLSARPIGAVSPNFLRVVSKQTGQAPHPSWAHAKIGIAAAWQLSKGSPDIRIALLDEGVDTDHPALQPAVVGQRDFVGGTGDSALPSGNDAHGTACAGIIVSRDRTYVGIAPKCSLLAARIAMDDGSGHWMFDDWAAAEGIDWAWREGADILSNSWGGGPPSDAISRAFGRARTEGRKGKGAVVVIAAGNNELTIGFPGDLPGYLTVGASTPKDERKTMKSSDKENWWGSNYGPTLSLLAPGVFIRTCDIHGPAGYSPNDFTDTFNGTSAATPHVAAAAALMLSVNSDLSGAKVMEIIQSTAKPLPKQKGRTDENGWGRLDVAAAVKAALPAQRAKAPTKSGTRKTKPVRRTA